MASQLVVAFPLEVCRLVAFPPVVACKPVVSPLEAYKLVASQQEVYRSVVAFRLVVCHKMAACSLPKQGWQEPPPQVGGVGSVRKTFWVAVVGNAE